MDAPAVTQAPVDHSNLIADAISGGDTSFARTQEPPVEIPVVEKAKAKPETPAAPEVKQEVAAPEKPEVKEPEVEVPLTPEEKYLAELGKLQPEAPVLDDNAKAALKAKGIEDLDARLQEWATDKELATQYKTKAEQYEALQKALKELPVEFGAAIEAFRKGEDYTKHLTPLTKGISMNKEAKDIDRFDLVDHEFPGKFTEDQKQAIKDGLDDTLKAAHDLFYDQAAGRHDGRRAEWMQSTEARAQQAAARRDADQKATAAAIAHAKGDPAVAALLTPELLSDFETGALVDKLFYNADGTPNLKSLALAAKAVNHDAVVTRAMKGAAVKGKIEGELRVRETMPEKPASGTGEVKGPTVQTPEKGSAQEIYEGYQNLVASALGHNN